jgi:ATP-dependent helicase/nuclease subunit A
MVLVRRRTGFVDELVRQLKALEIPVAGVDRMVLPQQLAVMDLMALGRFLLLPGDDLTLATVLKSPLIGLSEDDLFDLAWPRGEASLWEALSRHAGGDSVFGRAHKLLEDLLARVDYLTPYELFAHVCVAADGRRKTLGRLGLDADDPIDEFLSLALAYERNRPPSLQAFLHWVEQGGIEIKRDLEQDNADAVRIMTVHGAKGLQAPIVFLPDTLQVPTLRDALVWTADAAPVPVWTAGAADRVAEAARQAAKERQMDEYRRLLYVALTRAEDRLYVCGWENSRAASAGNWYELIERALSDLAAPSEDAFLAAEGVAATAMVRVLESAQTAALRPRAAAAPAPAPVPLPAWTATPAPPERDPPQPLAPSRATRAEPAALSPLAEDTAHRYRRGLIVHRLLQTLPELPPERRRAAAEAYVARPAWRLPAEQRRALVAETLGVLETPAFAPLFAAGALAEVPVVGLVGRHAVSGQVDRLAVTAHEVWIVDYKTNRPAPRAAADVDPGYVTQMAVYREVLRRIYPHHAVRCVLLWTDGPRAMELPTDMLDAALAQAAGAAA